MQNQINNLIKNKVAPIKVIFLVFLIGMGLFLANNFVSVYAVTQPSLAVAKSVRNLSYETSWLDSVSADPNNRLSFSIQITAGSASLYNVMVKDTLPDRIIYRGNLRIDGILSAGDIISGVNIGDLSPYQTKTITFDVVAAGPEQFAFGETQLINTVLVYTTNVANSDTAKIIVVKKAVPGVVPSVPTGFANNVFLDFFFLPLLISLTIIWFFRFHIIKFEKWLDQKKKEYRKYRAEKILELKIAQIKAREFFQKMKIK